MVLAAQTCTKNANTTYHHNNYPNASDIGGLSFHDAIKQFYACEFGSIAVGTTNAENGSSARRTSCRHIHENHFPRLIHSDHYRPREQRDGDAAMLFRTPHRGARENLE
jgi:hypothetical protein